MTSLPARRFHKLHEQLLLSRWLMLVTGWLASVALPAAVLWGGAVFVRPNPGQLAALLATTLAFVLSHLGAKTLLSRYPGGRSQGLIVTQIVVFYTGIILVTLLARIDISRALLLASGGLALIWFHLEYLLTRTYLRPKLAVVPGGFADEILKLPDVDTRPVRTFSLDDTRYDGVVADFSAVDAKQQRFLTACALASTPVYNAKTIYESLTGRVRIDRMSENNLGSLLPSPAYQYIRTVLDWLIVLACLPIIVPVGLLAALLIRLESPGPVIYRQTRIGRGNKPFTLYKLRSMVINNDAPEQFARAHDPRITRVGRFIRLTRIDELPQFWNVLKGDMSLIGPRPEQPGFVDEFNDIIPFYSYRHVVKPGITGWAQVRQGYAASDEDTRIKIEHDFYYIKHCSLALDFYILILTARTMFSGFGAR